MSNAGNHHRISYIEFASTDIEATKKFYSTVFGWSFVDYGPDYVSFTAASAGIDGGFYKIGEHEDPPKYAPLVVLYSAELKATEAAIVAAGGSILCPPLSFRAGGASTFPTAPETCSRRGPNSPLFTSNQARK